ncbi:putative RNA 2'-phosphotransferase (plasmid) [Deinococcus gobiensis I-0]|uniref:Putative RNA 2'-phosphotransferase n=1 Tax=Deinococcus gobiensis (strain DSM 21396 / JCM 16679 / CGMCC 1.7299 / I-0) TaxID=745776 RepID=H8H0X2_DEIGI|nr:putative RNA 2'-phosphotransferase [Deinococcus gobiensis I-0]
MGRLPSRHAPRLSMLSRDVINKLLAFEARLVSAAIESADGLYVRTTDDVLSVGPNGQVTRIHTLDEQSSFGFKGLALHQGA